MKVHHVLIGFFFFTLQAGNIGVHAGRRILTGTEGGSITVACSFMFAGDRRFFCKQECEESILIETTSDRDENGRYKVEYSKTFYLSYPVLYVTITRLSKSDAGPYVCGLGKPLFPDSQEDFELVVKDGISPQHRPFSTPASTAMMTPSLSSSFGSLTSSPALPEITEQTERTTAPLGSVPTTSKPNWTLQTFPTSASTPTTTQHLSSSSVRFTSSSASPETTEQTEQQQTERTTAPLGSWNLLYVGFALLMMMAVLLVFGLLFRATRYKEYLLKAEYSRGRYIDLNGDNDRTTAAGSQNQVGYRRLEHHHFAPQRPH
ncbi:uncharacterized protein LOC113744734 isoform X2 [Larimichthys crocea]|uniref:uncharacterized protein LOC113744734 isoform X2 n=1 Tax=Larimichthys crocea TaxID=215358 RepID=UPI000F5EA2CA|nr:uncharacterized protein LOC113744734 isoform X2 [Larimichthys crocea]